MAGRETGDLASLMRELEGLPRKTVACRSFAMEARVCRLRPARR